MLTKFIQNFLWLPLGLVFRFFLGYRVIGRENYRGLRKPFLIISNHVSGLDPFLLGAAFPLFSRFFPIRYAAKREIFDKKYQKIPVKAMGGFKVEKGVGLGKALECPLEILKSGGVVAIFPSGMREKPRGRPRKARRGAAYLALNTGVPILPMGVRNAKGLKWKDFFKGKLKKRKITVLIGKPFYLPGDLKYPRDIDEATEIIDRTLTKLRRIRVKQIKNFFEWLEEWFGEEWIDEERLNDFLGGENEKRNSF